MRISTITEDRHYRRDAGDFSVTFNGRVIPTRLLLLADDATGLLVTLKSDKAGKILCSGEDTITVIERGKVTISEVVRRLPEEVPFG